MPAESQIGTKAADLIADANCSWLWAQMTTPPADTDG